MTRSLDKPFRERLTFDELQHQGALAVSVFDWTVLDAVDRGDVRMIQGGKHARLAVEPRPGTPADFAAFMARESEKWRAVVQAAKVRIE